MTATRTRSLKATSQGVSHGSVVGSATTTSKRKAPSKESLDIRRPTQASSTSGGTCSVPVGTTQPLGLHGILNASSSTRTRARHAPSTALTTRNGTYPVPFTLSRLVHASNFSLSLSTVNASHGATSRIRRHSQKTGGRLPTTTTTTTKTTSKAPPPSQSATPKRGRRSTPVSPQKRVRNAPDRLTPAVEADKENEHTPVEECFVIWDPTKESTPLPAHHSRRIYTFDQPVVSLSLTSTLTLTSKLETVTLTLTLTLT